MTQKFFDDISYEIVVPLIHNLDGILNITTGELPFFANLSIFTIAGNISNFIGNGTDIANDTSITTIHDDYIAVNITDLTIDFELGYEFITDPPIMADMGDMILKLNNFDLLFNMTSNYSQDNNNMTLNVTYVHASI